MMAARVAVAMAVYDDERYLAQALGALERQTFHDFHLTLLDDGSRDGSAALAESFASRLPMSLVRAGHRGRHHAKRAAADAALASGAEFFLVLDSDIALPPDALARMVAALDADRDAAVISAHARARTDRPLGAAQAFLEDVFLRSHAQPDGSGRWIVGGCALFRASLLRGLALRPDLPEDSELAEMLRGRFRLLMPLDLIADHYGVPTTLGGIVRRGHRDGVRVCSLLRVHPGARSLGSLARLAPLPLATLALLAVLAGHARIASGLTSLLAAYLAAFLFATRRVAAPLATRLSGALLFLLGNTGFAVGFAQEALRGAPTSAMREPERRF